MDTTTVLAIIEMIDNKIKHYWTGPLDGMPGDFELGEQSGMQIIRDHLQSYIEGQLNAAENQTGE